jgi:hypothetical protein
MRAKQYNRNITKDTFWTKVDKTDSCWNWTGLLDRDGYGYFYYDYRNHKSHRFVLNLQGKDIKGKVVCHTCDNRRCVNPEHLFVGSQADNIADMVAKDRHWKKSTHGVRKLRTNLKITNADKIVIKHSSKSVTELAKEYSVHRTSIYRIKKELLPIAI